MDPTDALRDRAFLTPREFAELTRSSVKTVRRGIKRGEIPTIQFSGTTRIPVSAVRSLLEPRPPAEPMDVP